MFKIILLLLPLCGLCLARTSSELRVRIDDGRIVGRYLTSESGRSIRAFMGIPYAEPPVGNLRFKAPVKVKAWQGILKAQTEPPMCIQVDPFTRSKTVEGREDCLYLNVYAPERGNRTEKLPVMVFIHGGGWMSGHGGISLYSPDHFLEHDVILVSGNYRLGALGFLSMEDKECSGNFGLKDQALMLQWVRTNIDKFGGDSGSVTIFGNSAGGASVNYHMISPMSKGLFDRGISQSGTIMNIWSDVPRPGLAKMRAIRLADKMNCPIINTNFKAMVECLRKVDAKKIAQALYEFYEWDIDPVIPFPPVVENAFKSEEEAFIPNMRYNKHSFDIPWMLGITSEEGLIRTASFFNNKKLMKDMVKNWERLLPFAFNYDHLYDDEQQRITEQINEFYFKGQTVADATAEDLTNLWGDGYFHGTLENIEFRLNNNLRDQTYVYLLSHKGAVSYSELLGGDSGKFYGSCHADELIYLFPQHKTIPAFFDSMPSKEDKELTRLMTKLWVNFAETSNPTPDWSTSSEFPLWLPARQLPLDYLVIGNQNGKSKNLLAMKKGLIDERASFWKKLRKDSPKWSLSFRDEIDGFKDEL